MIQSSRRGFIAGLAAAFAAPAIVRAGSLMPVKVMPTEDQLMALLQARMDDAYALLAKYINDKLYGITGIPELGKLTFNGIDLQFDPLVPKDVFYLVPGGA